MRSARNRIPAVVVVTRTFRERAARQPETAREALTAQGRRGFRSSQSFNQLLHQAEQAEDQHRQHDVHQNTHLVSIRWICGRRQPFTASSAGPSSARARAKLDSAAGAMTVVDTFFTPFYRLFTAFVGRRPIVAGAKCACRPSLLERVGLKTPPHQSKHKTAQWTAVGSFAPTEGSNRPRAAHLHHRRINVASTCMGSPHRSRNRPHNVALTGLSLPTKPSDERRLPSTIYNTGRRRVVAGSLLAWSICLHRRSARWLTPCPRPHATSRERQCSIPGDQEIAKDMADGGSTRNR